MKPSATSTEGTKERVLDEKFIRYPLAKLLTPQAGFLRCMTDHWWAVTANDEVLFYKKIFQSPQCNLNKAIVERLCPKGTTPRFVPVAFIPDDPRNYL